MNIDMQGDNIDTARVALIGTTGSSYSLFGMPFGELAGMLTALYVLIKIINASPQLIETLKGYYNKLFK